MSRIKRRSREQGEDTDSSKGSESEQFTTPGKEEIGARTAVRGSGVRRGRPTNLERLSR